MANYVMVFKGGSMAPTEAEREAAMAAWGGWFGTLGSSLVEPGNPFGPSSSAAEDGSMNGSAPSGLTGYTVVAADSLAAAAGLAKGCPIFAGGGSVEVYEAIPVGM